MDANLIEKKAAWPSARVVSTAVVLGMIVWLMTMLLPQVTVATT